MRTPAQILQKPDYGPASAIRVVETVAAFKERHGAWPDTIDVDSGMLEGLAEHVLTPLGVDLLHAALSVKGGAEGTLIATGNGQRLEYGDHSPTMATMKDAARWIWACDFN